MKRRRPCRHYRKIRTKKGIKRKLINKKIKRRNYRFAPGPRHLRRSKRSDFKDSVLQDLNIVEKTRDPELYSLAKDRLGNYEASNPMLYEKVKREHLYDSIRKDLDKKYGKTSLTIADVAKYK